jgi:anti-sigma-K factor RskA
MAYDEHSPFIENIPAYAIGALDGEDVAALEVHLKTCASCRTELAAYRAVGESLLMAIPPKQPSAAIRNRLQSQLPSAQKTLRPRLNWSMSRMVVGAAFTLLLVLNAYLVSQVHNLQLQQSQLASQIRTSQTVLAMLSYPNTQNVPIDVNNSVTGTLLLDKDRNVATIVVWNMPQLPANQTYQMWLIDSQGDRTSAGIFRPNLDQSYTITSVKTTISNNLSNFVGIGVTIEPAGGSDHPTGSRVFKVDF